MLVLDDATSAVDANVEARIHDALRSAMAGRTTLLIAHRQSTLALADQIAVLDEGRLVDLGTHEELTARCPLYRRLLSGPAGPGSSKAPAQGGRAEVITSALWVAAGGAGRASAGAAGAVFLTSDAGATKERRRSDEGATKERRRSEEGRQRVSSGPQRAASTDL